MRVLWICNIIIPRISKAINAPIKNNGGWLTGISNSLLSDDSISLCMCFPFYEAIHGMVDHLEYYGFSTGNQSEISNIIKSFNPDIIHVWGTESEHSLSTLLAADQLGLLDHTVVSIQGLRSVYSEHYYACLPNSIVNGWSIRDLLRHDNIANQKKRFKRKGISEEKALKITKHVIGRTDWDRACIERINPNVTYHFCNETLRDSFYDNAGHWDYKDCEKHSIFVSQSHYPIKGFHFMLQALQDVVKQFPDTILYTTGVSPFEHGIKARLHKTYYNVYIGKLIKMYGLIDKVVFLGDLTEAQMCDRFLRSNVFVSCSAIENSPNSLGEAMMLGVPVVASDVGGVKNLMVHGKEGYIYPYDEPYMCAYYINKIFNDNSIMDLFSKAEYEHSRILYNKEENMKQLIAIYKYLSQ